MFIFDTKNLDRNLYKDRKHYTYSEVQRMLENNINEEIDEMLWNINDECIAKLGTRLIDADSEMFAAEKERMLFRPNDFTDSEKQKIAELTINLKKDEADKYIKELQKEKMGAVQQLDINIINAKLEFRKIGIMFDTIKLIVENRKAKN